MPIRVECDVCGARYRVDDRRAGTEIPCKECDTDIWVPELPRRGGAERRPRGGRRTERAAVSDQFDYEEPEEHAGSFWSSPAVFVGFLLGGGVLLAGAVFGLMYAMKDDPAPANQVAQKDADKNPANVQPQPNPIPVKPQPQPIRPNPQPKPDQFNGQPKPNPFERKPQPEPIKPRPVNPPIANKPPEREKFVPRGFQPPDKNQASLPPDLAGKWDVKFDANPEPIAFEDQRKLRVPLPSGVNVQDVLWPMRPSFFVALGNNSSDRNVREVYDIRTRKKVGKIGGFRAYGGKSALSPDGKFFVISSRETNGILVWDVAGDKAKGTLPLPASRGATAMNFAGTKRLAAVTGSKSPLQIWSMPDGNPERTINLPEQYAEKSLAFSHGGKYAAVYIKKRERPRFSCSIWTPANWPGPPPCREKATTAFSFPIAMPSCFPPMARKSRGCLKSSAKASIFTPSA